jgi:MYXO-CTERM domain-containing protein
MRKISLAFIMVVPLFAAVPNANASFIYSYTGNPFTTCTASGVPGGECEVGGGVSGEFTVASGLGDDFSGSVTPTQFSFSGGVFVPITSSDSPVESSFYIQTSDTGAIVQWSINLFYGSSFGLDISTSNSGDSVDSIGPTTIVGDSNSNDPGSWTWTDPPSPTPLPPSISLFAVGLGALGLLGWRRKRKNAAAIAVV